VKYRLQERTLAGPLRDLDQRRWLFDNLPLDPTHATWLRQRAWVRTIHGTTRIEGNTLSDVEVEALLAGEGTSRVSEREAREIVGTREALSLADELAPEPVPVDEALVRELHRRVLWNQSPLLTPGVYRRGENRVVDAAGELVFSTPPSGDVPGLMHDLAEWLATAPSIHPAPVVAALAHLELVAIHPFNDGNGRTARAVSRLVLGRHGYALGGLVSLDAQLDLQREDYFGAIRYAIGRAYAPGYDATPFAAYFVRSITAAADHVLSRVRGLGEVMIAIRRGIAGRPAPGADRRAGVRLGQPTPPGRGLHPAHRPEPADGDPGPGQGGRRRLARRDRPEAGPLLRPGAAAPGHALVGRDRVSSSMRVDMRCTDA
jgi:hypothetical protein